MEQKIFLISDWQRILLGNTPWYFLLEVLVRAGAIYMMLMLVMRLLGKHVAAQYTLFEMSAVITLSSAAGVVLTAPDNGMLPPFTSLITVLALHHILSKWRRKNQVVEMAVTGEVLILVKNGQLLGDNMKMALISKKKIFEILRERKFQHLSQISRLYLEPSGNFSIIAANHPKPGLSILPSIDRELHAEAAVDSHFACMNCGNVTESQLPLTEECKSCGSHAWTKAVLELG